jgi:transcriptional regulator with XRE-family HTH domain
MKFGERIRYYAAKRGVTIGQLAEGANISRSHLYRILNENTQPHFPTLAKLANALEITLAQLLEEGEPGDLEAHGQLGELMEVCHWMKHDQLFRILRYARYERDTG